ncbi:hypothetical protein [Sphaerochaeta pleomorpha]|uniref:hypothetical protein n=1 Tax=Sphaerochaeta pleomorpha TaxID=1131707 RepID=UPI0012DD4683|nr:hypothetical protein [Sphaerochaeta pleomorpha]
MPKRIIKPFGKPVSFKLNNIRRNKTLRMTGLPRNAPSPYADWEPGLARNVYGIMFFKIVALCCIIRTASLFLHAFIPIFP